MAGSVGFLVAYERMKAQPGRVYALDGVGECRVHNGSLQLRATRDDVWHKCHFTFDYLARSRVTEVFPALTVAEVVAAVREMTIDDGAYICAQSVLALLERVK